MDAPTAKQFLMDQVPTAHQRLFPPTLKLAYAAAADLVKSTPMLQIPSAEDNRGRLIAWAVDFAFKGLIESGQWPADYRWRQFAKPTGRYLEVRLSHSVLTVSQVRDPDYQPRDVAFRANARLRNQKYLFPEFADDEIVAGVPALLLVHGHKDPNFAYLGVPNPVHEFGYIWKTPNLMQMPYELPNADLTPPEDPVDPGQLVSLKEEIDKWRRDNRET